MALDQAAGDDTSAAGKRVVSLIEELRMVLTCLMSANPQGMQSLRCASRLTVHLCLLVSAAPEACTCPAWAWSRSRAPHADSAAAIPASAYQENTLSPFRNHAKWAYTSVLLVLRGCDPPSTV